MLSRRLAAHSNQKVLSLAAITELGRSADIDELVVSLSGGSPRSIIRICKAIFDQQSELNSRSRAVSERAVLAGIEDIAAAIAAEKGPGEHPAGSKEAEESRLYAHQCLCGRLQDFTGSRHPESPVVARFRCCY